MTVSAAFTALADPTRRQIIAFLADGEQPVAQICEQFNCTAPAVSQHLKVLRETGLVTVRPAAQRRFYAVNKPALSEVAVWLSSMARLEAK
jgi:DNA-binding transcriptional ArsR family regulator